MTAQTLDHAPLLEVRLHQLSPFPPLVNGLLIAAVLYGAYLIIAIQVDQTLLETRGDQVVVNPGAWAAFVLSLIFSTGVSIAAYSHRQWKASLDQLKASLDEVGQAKAEALAIGPPREYAGKSMLAFALGGLGGVVFVLWLMHSAAMSLGDFVQSTGIWFLVTQPFLFGLGARAALQLRQDDKDIASMVRDHLIVDLARLDQLEVYGRLALRSALSWLLMAAIIMLFFVYAATVAVSIGSLILSLAAGAYAFASTVGPVVQRVSEVRDEKLVEIRAQIAQAGEALAQGAPAGKTPISELAAYEIWLEKRPVWPISAPISQRLALYGFIPVIAWFGAAAAELVLDQLA